MSEATSLAAVRNSRDAHQISDAAGVAAQRASGHWYRMVEAFDEQQACRSAFALAEQRQVRLSVTDCDDGVVEGLISRGGRIVFRHREQLSEMGALWHTLAAWLTEVGQLTELRGRP